MKEGEASQVAGEEGAGKQSTPTPSTVSTLRENLTNLLELKKVHSERLETVEEELSKLQKYKKDYESLSKRLKTLPDKISHEAMVPLGPLALMPGRIIHTNEIMVLLGDNWFAERSAKQALEIVRRRIKDCDDRIRTAESTKQIHLGWLKEAEEVLQGDQGDQVEIIEEITEEEYQRSKESRVKGQTHEEEPHHTPSLPSYVQTMEEKDRRSYEELMERLDQLELEEMGDGMEALEEEEEEEEEEVEEEEEEEDVHTEDIEVNEEPEVVAVRSKSRTVDAASDDRETNSDGGEAGAEEDSRHVTLPKKHPLRRRVSWADDIRPLYTVIPDDDSEEVCRIQYTSQPSESPPTPPLALPLQDAEGDVGEEGKVKSPSDIYKVFGKDGDSAEGCKEGGSGDVQPRSILKKSKSLPIDGSNEGDGGVAGEGWCCPPKPLDVEGEELDDQPEPPPSPPPKRNLSFKPAFSYRVLERKGAVSSSTTTTATTTTTTTTTSPKKVSKFRADRMKK